MKKILLLTLLPLLMLSGCNNKTDNNISKDYGVFLGASEEDKDKIKDYKNITIELEEFEKSTIKEFRSKDIHIYAYLSVGSLETYRDYYDEYKNLTFKAYDNWPDEFWIDVSNSSWQSLLINIASDFKDYGADGLFLDNFDVYYQSLESNLVNSEDIYKGCKVILEGLSNLNMNITINSGTDFLERLYDENDPLLKKITWYAQESVFSKIENYDLNIFVKQDKEETEYYQSIINIMKPNSNILLIEYTIDKGLIEEIKKYCSTNDFSYYITNSINLTI